MLRKDSDILPSQVNRTAFMHQCDRADENPCFAEHFDNSQIADILRKTFPEQASRIPSGEVSAGPAHFKSDSSKVQKQLDFKFRSFKESVVDTATALFALEKKLKA